MITFWKNRRRAKIRELLSSYIDGEVSASEARRVEELLASSDEYGAELESLRQTTMLLRQMPQLEPPRSYALNPADVEEATPRRRFPSFESFTGGLATAGAAALVVVLVVGVVFLARLGFTGLAAEAPQAAAPAPAAAPAELLLLLRRLLRRQRLKCLVPYQPHLKLRVLRLRSHLRQLWQRLLQQLLPLRLPSIPCPRLRRPHLLRRRQLLLLQRHRLCLRARL